MTGSEIKAALSERHAVALTLWAEARSDLVAGKGWRTAPLEARIAVACVIRNRVRAPKRFGLTAKDVCLKPFAFSCWVEAGGKENYEAVMARADLFVREGDASALAKGDAVLRECLWIADGLLADTFGDRVNGATHYYATWMPKPPAWAFTDPKTRQQPLTPTATVGHHLFFAGVR